MVITSPRMRQGLERSDQGQGSVGEQGKMGHTEVIAQLLLQLGVKLPAVGQPAAFPDALQQGGQFRQLRQKRAGNRNLFFVRQRVGSLIHFHGFAKQHPSIIIPSTRMPRPTK